MKKRILSCLMALALCLTLLPTAALAEGETIKEVNSAPELKTAIETGSNSIVKLTGDIEIDTTLKVSREVTLDLNGKVLKMTGTGSVIEVQNSGNLTLTDSNSNETHKFSIDESTRLWILDETSGANTVNGGVITGGNANANNNDGGGVRIVSGTFTMTGGNIVGCTAYAGGGVDVGGTFTMTGGSIAGCVATGASGGGVYVETGGIFEMSGGSIAGCTVASKRAYGGGICNTGTTTLSGSAKIQNCHVQSTVNGGGIESAGVLTVNGNVEITGCTMGMTPDAMHFNNGTVSGGIFDGKVTKLDGTISGGRFDGEVINRGGAISGGTFNREVSNEGNIENGMFNGEVINQSNGTIKAGTFRNTVDNLGTIGGGTFSGTVENAAKGKITDGTFTETSTVNNKGTIEKGEFSGKVENQTGGTIGGGMFSGTVTNNGTINGGTFAVTFDTKGGSSVQVQNILNGQRASEPADPTKTGYTFGGWYTEKTCTNPYEFTTPVQNALTLYAKWTINQYTITFKPENGDEDTTITQDYDTPVTAPANPTRTGYTFAGWDREIPATMPAENMTVTAQWTAVGSGSSGGGSSSGGSSSSSKPSASTGKTETVTKPDGTKVQTETKADGTKIQTTTGKDGSVTKTETKKDGSSVTENKAADGSTGTVKTDKNGNTEAETKVSAKAVEDAKKSGEAVKAPVEVEASRDSSTAPTVKVELPKNSGDTKVEIPVSNVKPGTVAVLVHADGTEEIVKNSLPTEDGIQLTINGGATVKIVDNSKGFIDTQDHWAKDAIDFVSARGLVNGMSATIYAPNNSTTRAQLWTILARQNDADLTGGSIWYEKAQNWAKEKGISDGANPNGTINRAQMVTMLWRAMGQPAAGSTANFIDVPADAYYAQAVSWAVENGITTGVGGGRFDPNSTCTRAQIATFLYRLYLSR